MSRESAEAGLGRCGSAFRSWNRYCRDAEDEDDADDEEKEEIGPDPVPVDLSCTPNQQS